MAEIGLERLTKVYGDGTRAVSELDLEIADGEFVVLVGPSGCGKTSALRMVAGLEPITEGRVLVGGKVVNNLPPKDRDMAMIFQNYALYPHMSAFDNMAFGLKLRGVKKERRRERVGSTAATLGLAEVLGKKPRTLSGGQRQRVAMGRAIVREPQAFLMDEPLSNLDAKLRVEMRAEIARLQRDLGVTTIYVTHDQVEAMTLGDRVAIMRNGVLQQVDSPQKLYDEPANLFVAEFIGSPAMNLVGADIARSNGAFYATFGEHRLRIAESVVAARPALPRFEGQRIILGIRPEDLEDAALEQDFPEDRRLLAVVDIREDMGSEVFVHFGVGARAVRGEDVKAAVGEEALEAGKVTAAEKGSVFVARLDRATRAAEGQQVELAVDTDRLHFFDPATGLGIYRAD
ncbi:MAG TPA: sn-glycerol-3-phosphate ABC transporter ATP-binding protein UgpC [Gaiellaceae bacterium]|jgi:multiple sugar transport system ATP-binding protein|nr:sn-glycerol-3-phosphate ABC transporter ATP-binding protein UgpC [Gaiellaceae bacterium]